MPFKSEEQRKAMYAAAAGKSTLGIPEEVGKKFVSHGDDDGEAAPALLPDITELDVMRGIRDEALASPQQFGDVWLFAIRVSGTGYAERASGEIGFKSPSDYLTSEFMTRCQGLPVVWEHPAELLLTTDSFRNQIVGTSVLPYIRSDEVWTIARIYDKEAAQLMQENQLSTSPAVSISNAATKIGDVLIEGNPVYIDHIAICQQGVWDKKGNPTGVRLDSMTHEVNTMDEEKKEGEGLRETLSKLLEEHTARIDAKFDEVHNRLDEMGEKKDDDMDSLKADESLDPEEKEEVKEEIEEAHHVVEDDAMCDSADDVKADDDDDESSDEPKEEEKVKDDAKGDGARADSMKIARLERELKALRRAVAQPSVGDREAIAKAISRADSIYMALGETNAVVHVPGESEFSFRKRIASKLSQYSNRFKNVDVSRISDSALFAPIEDAIYADSMDYAKAPPIAPGTVHMIEKKGPGGRSIFEPSSNSDPHGWMDTFSNGVQFRGGFISK